MQSYEAILREKGLTGPGAADELLGLADRYAERMQEALRRICRSDYPPGMLLWLEGAHPHLYAELTGRLPDEMQGLWAAHAPLKRFQVALDRLVEAHQEAFKLYRQQELPDETS